MGRRIGISGTYTVWVCAYVRVQALVCICGTIGTHRPVVLLFTGLICKATSLLLLEKINTLAFSGACRLPFPPYLLPPLTFFFSCPVLMSHHISMCTDYVQHVVLPKYKMKVITKFLFCFFFFFCSILWSYLTLIFWSINFSVIILSTFSFLYTPPPCPATSFYTL